jgi:hypothetical protein
MLEMRTLPIIISKAARNHAGQWLRGPLKQPPYPPPMTPRLPARACACSLFHKIYQAFFMLLRALV